MSERLVANGNQEGHQNPIDLTTLLTHIDHESADVQLGCGLLLWRGEGCIINFRAAAYCFKLSADQGNADGQWCYG
jgi:TPR repeat protein